jgi:hypothetical protein
MDLLAFGVTETRRQQPQTRTADETVPLQPQAYAENETVPLARSGRIAGRFWRRSKAEQAALAYRELGYSVEVAEELRARSFRDWGYYSVVVFGKTS